MVARPTPEFLMGSFWNVADKAAIKMRHTIIPPWLVKKLTRRLTFGTKNAAV